MLGHNSRGDNKKRMIIVSLCRPDIVTACSQLPSQAKSGWMRYDGGPASGLETTSSFSHHPLQGRVPRTSVRRMGWGDESTHTPTSVPTLTLALLHHACTHRAWLGSILFGFGSKVPFARVRSSLDKCASNQTPLTCTRTYTPRSMQAIKHTHKGNFLLNEGSISQ